ncbi:MAG: 2-oxoacid:acceptor oxidoreductase family protein [Oscillospiraceae bacterium]|nr:2-oxoacid:acceptor oxidoreductase family protein [Oscillospiraceae bacterium]MDD4414876.1 2-oxoacid:acceptor oxidoreductase family protein [Oscillospiraceae bacterium]
MRTENIIIAGFGGQGIVAAGRTLAYAGMTEGKKTSMLPSYGPEMRGGFANCHVIISDSDIASPIVSKPDIFIAMSHPAADRFEPMVKPGKTMIVDSYQVKDREYRNDINVIKIPATKIAMDAGNVKFSNMVMIGALMAVLDLPSVESMTRAVRNFLPKGKEDLLPLEMKVLSEGMKFAEQKSQRKDTICYNG